jgi:hypothetical protein
MDKPAPCRAAYKCIRGADGYRTFRRVSAGLTPLVIPYSYCVIANPLHIR